MSAPRRQRTRALILATATAVALAVAGIFGCGGGDETASVETAINRGPQQIRVAAAGDFGLEAPAEATLQAMADAEPDFVLALGDLSYAGLGSEPEFCDLVRSSLGDETPVELVSGNHEDDTGGDGMIAAFARCLPDRLDAIGDYGTQYYFDVGQLARFIMIAPDLTIGGDYHYYGAEEDGADTPDLTWLRETIDDARANGVEWVIVGMHKNCISVGEYYCDVYQDLFSTLIEKRVDLVLTGHDHTYQRSKQLDAPSDGCPTVVVDRFDTDCVVNDSDTYERGAGTTFVVVGTGGQDLYTVHPDDPEAGYFAAYMGNNTSGNRHGFADLSISSESLEVEFVGSTPGTFSDRFQIASPSDP